MTLKKLTQAEKNKIRRKAIEAITDENYGDDGDNFHEHATAQAVISLLDELELKTEQRANWCAMAKKLGEDLDAAEKRISELENDEVRQQLANAEHQLHMAELAKHNLRASRKAQFRKRKAAELRVAELEAREVNLPKRSVGEVMHISGFSRDYAEGWCSGNDNAIREIHAAGVKVAAGIGKGECPLGFNRRSSNGESN
ncbi:hypothetical protein [Enterobacter quasiroggenkampii]|uniref:hypothetical protein n=1 Tax=Enterobacter quasiroggenkampii TaxID=2497436 RepID=UPI0021D0AF7A|nr:hypothetical protein [Enterobacter quasiroggenkampii]